VSMVSLETESFRDFEKQESVAASRDLKQFADPAQTTLVSPAKVLPIDTTVEYTCSLRLNSVEPNCRS
jgi:hypothetical protein